MKRWIALSVVLAVMVGAGHAVTIPEGSKELAVEGLFDANTRNGEQTDITFLYAEFPEDNMEIALLLRAVDTDTIQQWRIGMRAEVTKPNFEVAPFAGVSVEYASFTIDYPVEPVPVVAEGEATVVEPAAQPADQNREDSAVIVGGQAGLKWFITENIAVSGAFVYEWASEDVFEQDEGELDDQDISVRFGMRYFF